MLRDKAQSVTNMIRAKYLSKKNIRLYLENWFDMCHTDMTQRMREYINFFGDVIHIRFSSL